MSDTRWLSVDEIAAHLGVGKETIYAWIEKRDLPAHRVGRFWKFQKEDVDNWVKSGKAAEEDKKYQFNLCRRIQHQGIKNMSKKQLKPFLKWAGGKGQLLPEIEKYYPFDNGEITKYAEPFVGGGAVLFDILSKYDLEAVYISDINAELINTYRIIRDNIYELIEMLMVMQNKFVPMSSEGRKAYYLDKRSRFNDLKVNGNANINIEKAALMIFLNKTCFNGLFRVNKKGLFNVPMGAYKKPMICDEDNLRIVSQKLQNVDIVCGDYRESADFIDDNTFVYFDPPYRPITDTASFTAYTENLFNDEEQIELARFVDDMHRKGAKVVISNSDPKNSNTEDDFFDNIYASHKIKRVEATRMINCNSEARGKIKELLISNF